MARVSISTSETKSCRRKFATRNCKKSPTCSWSAAKKPKPEQFPSATAARATSAPSRSRNSLPPSKPKPTRARSRKIARKTALPRKAAPPKRAALTQPPPPEVAATATKPLVHVTEKFFAEAVRELISRDADLARVVEKYGVPPLWVREPGFPTLVYIILEQQVSLASARALYQKLERVVSPFTPDNFLKLTEVEMRRLGFSRQKTHYTRLLAEAIHRKRFALHKLHELEDELAREQLTALKGIDR